MTEQNLPPTTAGERERIRAGATEGGRHTPRTTLRLLADIDRLTAERDAVQARLTASEAGAAAMRQALQAIIPWHDPHPAEGTDNRLINLCRAALAGAAAPEAGRSARR